jgi:membrane protein involved in colicin uptake
MKSTLVVAATILSFAMSTAAYAQSKVYTWTDAKGKLHITDELPPVDASIKDVVEAPQLTPEEARQLDQQRQRREDSRLDDQRRSETDEALRRARDADQKAREAIQRADEQTQRALDYRKHFGNTPSRREQFKYKIREEDQKAEAARAEAQRAIDRAKAASDAARATVNPPPEVKP